MPGEINILLIDSDPRTQSAVEHVLLGEGWHVRVVGDARQGMAELAEGGWRLVLVSTDLAPPGSGLFLILAELARTRVGPERPAIRVLFLVPGRSPEMQSALEARQLPYVLRPLHLHDFLDRVGDLLIEAGALAQPIRQVRPAQSPIRAPRNKTAEAGSDRGRMFASRAEYQMTEEEILEYERQEAEERKKKKKR
jgi:DNA-binding response OmpR family regulator